MQNRTNMPRLAKLAASVALMIGLAATAQAQYRPTNTVTFADVYMGSLTNTIVQPLAGMPAGITGQWEWPDWPGFSGCSLPSLSPSGSANGFDCRSNACLTFSSPVIVWSIAAMSGWGNGSLHIQGTLGGNVVWDFSSPAPDWQWFAVTNGAGHSIDTLVFIGQDWAARYTDIVLSDATPAPKPAFAVTCENFNELGNAYQKSPNNNGLTGLPAGISANFAYNCQVMWSPGINPPGSTATNSIQVGWTPAAPAVTFSKPVVLWSLQAFKSTGDPLTIVGKKGGVPVWSYTNSEAASGGWFMVARGAGKPIDELDINCAWWGVNFTDFYLSDATGITPFTNSSPYYVDGANPLASDYNPGTAAQPWKTLQWAAGTLQAGDTVLMQPGTYASTAPIVPVESGTAAAPITYQGGSNAVLYAPFQISSKSWINLKGFKITNIPTGSGVSLTSCTNMLIDSLSVSEITEGYGVGLLGCVSNTVNGCNIYHTGGSGISVWGVGWGSNPGTNYVSHDHVISSNIIDRACDGTGGNGYDECISIANGNQNVEVKYNTIKDTLAVDGTYGGEGLDVKLSARNVSIHHNVIHDIQRMGLMVDAAVQKNTSWIPAGLHNISVYNNQIYNVPSGGIMIEAEWYGAGATGPMDTVMVYNNLVYSNAGEGICVLNYAGANAFMTNIWISYNTLYKNSQKIVQPQLIVDLNSNAARVEVHGNLIQTTASELAIGVWPNKWSWNPPGYYGLANVSQNVVTDSGWYNNQDIGHSYSNYLAANLRFVNASICDFHLLSNSPAINIGTSPTNAPLFDIAGSARPCGGAWDAGAYEFIPSSPFSLGIARPTPSNLTLTLQGGPESHYRVDWTPALGNGAWTPLQDIPSLPCSPYGLRDSNAVSGATQRFYRAVLLTP